jgi:hypothetical protein
MSSKSVVVLHHVSYHFVVIAFKILHLLTHIARSPSTFFSRVDCGKWYCAAGALPEFMD